MNIEIIKPGHEYIVDLGEHNGTHFKQVVRFQEGPVKEVGKNGIQNIDLIDILLDRMNYLQTMNDRKYASTDNALMIYHLESFKEIDEARTRARENRGVEGTNNV